jgi:hypothetical protein
MLDYYRFGQMQRKPWANTRWRIGVTLLAMAALFITQDYLQGKYGVLSADYSPPFLISDKLSYWFIAGFLFGVVSYALITEGEYLIGLWKVAKTIEKGVGKEIEREAKGVEKAALKELKHEARILTAIPRKRKR